MRGWGGCWGDGDGAGGLGGMDEGWVRDIGREEGGGVRYDDRDG